MTTVADKLQPLCDPERPNLSVPFGFDFEGRRWAGATNGFAFAAIVGECDPRPNAPDVVGTLLSIAPPSTHRAPIASLREWAGPLPAPPPTSKRMVDCETCNGEGEVFCDECNRDGATCPDCNGDGEAEERPKRPEPRFGILLHGALNRILLAQVLATLPDGVTEVRVSQREEMDPYIFRTEGWIGIVMPVRGPSPGLPRFNLESAP